MPPKRMRIAKQPKWGIKSASSVAELYYEDTLCVVPSDCASFMSSRAKRHTPGRGFSPGLKENRNQMNSTKRKSNR